MLNNDKLVLKLFSEILTREKKRNLLKCFYITNCDFVLTLNRLCTVRLSRCRILICFSVADLFRLVRIYVLVIYQNSDKLLVSKILSQD